MKQKIHQVNAGKNGQRIEIYKCIQNQRLTEIRSSHFPIFLVKDLVINKSAELQAIEYILRSGPIFFCAAQLKFARILYTE